MQKENKVDEAPKKSSLIGKIAKVVLPLALGAVIIYFLFRDIDLAVMWTELKGANWGILLFSILFGISGHTIRGYRWELFLRPLGYKAKISRLNYATYGGYAINFVLPRAGEVWKCGVLVKDQDIPFSRLFGTMLLDRVFDTITVLCITLIAFLFNMPFFMEQLQHNEATFDAVINIVSSPYLYIAIFVVVASIYIIFRYFRELAFVKKIRALLSDITADMKAIWKMKDKWRLLIYTLGIWTSYFLSLYIAFFAFDFTENLGFMAGLIAFALSSVSMGVPSNGGIGPWHAAIIAVLVLYGVSDVHAKTFAFGVFALQSTWQIILGLFGIAMLATKSKKLKNENE